MKYFRPYLFFLAIGFISCNEDFFETTITIDLPPHEPALAVTAYFAAGDTTLSVFVAVSQGILDDTQPVVITDATAEVFRNGQSLGQAAYDSDRRYILSLPEPLNNDTAEYRLSVAAPGYEPVEAIQTMPVAVPVLSATYEVEGAIDQEGDKVNLLTVEFEDPAGVENYYSVSAYTITDDQYRQSVQLDVLDPITEHGAETLLLKDSSFDGKKYKWRLSTYSWVQPDDSVKMYVVLRSITPDKYFFLRSVYLYDETEDNPFAEPVVIHENMKGGYGIFSLESSFTAPVSF